MSDIRLTNTAVMVEYIPDSKIKQTNAAVQVEYVNTVTEVRLTNTGLMVEWQYEHYTLIFPEMVLTDGEGNFLTDKDGNLILSEDGIGVASQGLISDNIELAQHYGDLSVSDCSHIQTAGSVDLSGHYPTPTVDSALIMVETISSLGLAVDSALIMVEWSYGLSHIDRSTHGQTADNVTLSATGPLLPVDSSTHPQTSDNIELTQNYLKALVTDIGIMVEYFAYYYTLTIDDSVHAVTSDNVDLTYHSGVAELSVDDSVHAQTTENIVLTYTPPVVLVVNNSNHIQTSENTELQDHFIEVQDSVHYQASDEVELSWFPPIPYLMVNFTSHAVTSDKVDLVVYNPGSLTIQSSVHHQTAENILLGLLRLNNSSHGQTSESVILVQYRLANDAFQSQTADTINLSQNYILPTVNDSVHAQTSTTIVIYIIIIDNPFGWKKIPMAIGINGPGIR